jgi:4-amino-4-deoxy-L-arabinose transferase-like glycosyltransferase
MAIPARLGLSPLTSARIVNAIAALITASLLFALLEGAAGTAAAIVGVVIVLVTPAFVDVHLSVLSEPLFLASLVVTLFGMTRRPRRPLLTGIAAGIAAIVRYAGACAPLAVALWFFFSDKKPIRQRLTDASKAVLIPVILVGAWIIRSTRVTDGQEPIEVGLRGKLGATLREAANTIADWIAPGVTVPFVRMLIVLLLSAAIVVGIVRAKRRRGAFDWGNTNAPELLKATAVLLGSYVTVLLAARLLVGDSIPFDFRILSPVILLVEIAIVVFGGWILRTSSTAVRVGALAVFAFWLAGSAVVSGGDVYDAVTDGSDFASSDWRDSPTLEWVRTRSAGRALFTNWPAAVYFRGTRIARDIPASLDAAQLREFRGILDEQHGAFVAFSSYNTDYPPSDSVAHKAGLVELARFSDGTVWVSDGSKPP